MFSQNTTPGIFFLSKWAIHLDIIKIVILEKRIEFEQTLKKEMCKILNLFFTERGEERRNICIFATGDLGRTLPHSQEMYQEIAEGED